MSISPVLTDSTNLVRPLRADPIGRERFDLLGLRIRSNRLVRPSSHPFHTSRPIRSTRSCLTANRPIRPLGLTKWPYHSDQTDPLSNLKEPTNSIEQPVLMCPTNLTHSADLTKAASTGKTRCKDANDSLELRKLGAGSRAIYVELNRAASESPCAVNIRIPCLALTDIISHTSCSFHALVNKWCLRSANTLVNKFRTETYILVKLSKQSKYLSIGERH